jgi:outer membrane protein
MKVIRLFLLAFFFIEVTCVASEYSALPDLQALDSSAHQAISYSEIAAPCRFEQIHRPITLYEVVQRALCNDPKTRHAWIDVNAQIEQVGISKSAYLPSINGAVDFARINSSTVVNDVPELSSSLKTSTRNTSLNLGWTLFDFGYRNAKLENARQLLIAAKASQDSTLQTAFVSAAQEYYDVLSAQSALEASIEAENSAKESWLAADAKYSAGVGTLADKLQAQTTYAQASLNRVKAHGELENARGVLSIAIGLDPSSKIEIAADDVLPYDVKFEKSIGELIEAAKRSHPSLLAAQAKLKAAQENIKVVKAEGLPSVSLIGSTTRNNPSSGFPALSSNSRSSTIGVQVTVPLFEGFGRSHKINAAEIEAESKAVDLSDIEMQISLEVWKSFQELATESENLKATQELLNSATESFDLAKGTYKAGVGSILDLLNAQSALAAAKQQRIQALSNWRIARLKLAASLGKLGFWAIKQ